MAGNENARDGLALARQMYIFGLGNDGVPCRDRKKLLEVSTVTHDTLRGHVLKWENEAEQIARNREDSTLGFCLREESVIAHSEDVDFLRRETDRLKHEVENLDEIQLKLTTLVENIADNLSLTGDDYDSVSRLLSKYLDHSANKAKVLSLFLAVQKRWQDSSAVSSTIAAYETSLKETAKRKAKQAGENDRTPGPDELRNAGHSARENGGVFKRG